MFMLHKPSVEEIDNFIAAQSNLPLSYAEIGATVNHASPAGYPINHLCKELGKGRQTYKKAVDALRSWQIYATKWTEVFPANAPIEKDEVVVMIVKHLGFWSLNPCRVVYTIEEKAKLIERNSFAIGTLPAHSEKGEERFTVEWDKQTDTVYYELYAFAKAHNWLAKVGFPFVPLFQKRFAIDSYEAMLAAVK